MITDVTAKVLAIVRAPLFVQRYSDKRLIVVHRISLAKLGVPDSLLGWESIAKHYGPGGDLEDVTGGLCPYHYLARVGGEMEQLLPVLAVGAHAAGMNRQSISVAVVGEHLPASPEQLAATVALVRSHTESLLLGTEAVVGHCSPVIDGLHGAPSKAWPEKLCPEPVISVAELRRALALSP